MYLAEVFSRSPFDSFLPLQSGTKARELSQVTEGSALLWGGWKGLQSCLQKLISMPPHPEASVALMSGLSQSADYLAELIASVMHVAFIAAAAAALGRICHHYLAPVHVQSSSQSLLFISTFIVLCLGQS